MQHWTLFLTFVFYDIKLIEWNSLLTNVKGLKHNKSVLFPLWIYWVLVYVMSVYEWIFTSTICVNVRACAHAGACVSMCVRRALKGSGEARAECGTHTVLKYQLIQ